MARKRARKNDSPRRQPAGERDAPALDPVTFGLLLACVIAGPPLWALYRSGDIDLMTFLLHGELITIGCGVGITALNGLIAEYRRQADREQRIRQVMDAIENVPPKDTPISPAGPGTPSPPPATPDQPDQRRP